VLFTDGLAGRRRAGGRKAGVLKPVASPNKPLYQV
jgi:hypothetical protein